MSDSKEPSVRFHSIRMMALLLVHLPDTTRIELTLFNKAQSAFIKRAKDKVAQIRIQAMKAMTRLQDCRDPNCLVTDCYLHHAERDPNWQVRRAALISLQREFLNFNQNFRYCGENVRYFQMWTVVLISSEPTCVKSHLGKNKRRQRKRAKRSLWYYRSSCVRESHKKT